MTPKLVKTAAMECLIACPGHGLPFSDLAGRCRTLLMLQEKRCQQVLRLVRERGPVSSRDLSLLLFGPVRAFDVFLTLSEVRGAMDVLEDEGSLIVDRSGPVDLAVAA